MGGTPSEDAAPRRRNRRAALTAALSARRWRTMFPRRYVSGAIAALLSVRRGFIGQSREVKKPFTTNATWLGRGPRSGVT